MAFNIRNEFIKTISKLKTILKITLIVLLIFIFVSSRLCPKIAEYESEFFKSAKFLAHYANVTMKLFSDIKVALQVDNFGKNFKV